MKIPAFASLALATLTGIATAQSSCSTTLTASYAAPSVASGYQARLIANGLSKPRSIKFDTQGHLLVVEANKGVTALTLTDSGNGCVIETHRQTVIENNGLTHGLELSPNGSTLYASSSSYLWSWEYDAGRQAPTTSERILVQNMEGSDHTTRTMLLSRHAPGMLVVCRGSSSNIDLEALDIRSTHSQIKAFNLNNMTQPYDYVKDGLMLGWGLRNEVGVNEEPITGGIYGVENSADDLNRTGVDIHEDNPAEELNFLGYLNGTSSPNRGRNFGYPTCFTTYNTSALPSYTGTFGTQFAVDAPNNPLPSDPSANDTACATNHQAPRLSFQPHMAPLTLLFNPTGTAAWITFHGSWDRTGPVGYKLSAVEFANGEPVHPSSFVHPEIDIFANADNSKCPNGCFRPVGLAWDAQGRLFVSADSTGEIYMITRTDGQAVNGSIASNGSSSSGTPTASSYPSGGNPTPTATGTSEASNGGASMGALALVFGLAAFFL